MEHGEAQGISYDIRTGGRRCTTSCVLFCTPSLVEVSEFVDKVFWAHMQVGGSSDRSDPLVRDLWDPSRWGPLGTHVSHRPPLSLTLSIRMLPLSLPS
jgi:hypothetical protein